LALAEGKDAWEQYLARVAASGRDCYAEIEFVRDDEPEQLVEDAATLIRWLSALESGTRA
jgi:hypothetical protein